MLSKQALSEFKIIYKEEFNQELSDEEVAKMANDLICLIKVLVQSSNKVRLPALKKKIE